jgi:AraC family transcriptional regulator
MKNAGAHGQLLADSLHSEVSNALVSRTLRKGVVAFTEIRSDNPTGVVSDPIPCEDAFLVAVQLRDFPRHEYWEDGRQAPIHSLKKGSTNLYDLKRNPAFRANNPFHSVHFYFPRTVLDAIAEDANARRIGDLSYEPGRGVQDPVVRSLVDSLYPVLERPQQASRIFIDHVMLAVGAHVAQTYGGMQPMTRSARGGLAPWQERRAKELIEANLDGELPLASLAAECGLSVSHFSRAFRQTMGTSPHRWLLQRRIEAAKTMLREQKVALSDVALSCGFADQSHFTRVFTGLLGASPGAWRRAERG